MAALAELPPLTPQCSQTIYIQRGHEHTVSHHTCTVTETPAGISAAPLRYRHIPLLGAPVSAHGRDACLLHQRVCVCDPRDAAVTCPARRGCRSCDVEPSTRLSLVSLDAAVTPVTCTAHCNYSNPLTHLPDRTSFAAKSPRSLCCRRHLHPSVHTMLVRTVFAPPSSVVNCLWELFVWGFGVLFLSCVCVCVCRCRGCCSLSVCACVRLVDLFTPYVYCTLQLTPCHTSLAGRASP